MDESLEMNTIIYNPKKDCKDWSVKNFLCKGIIWNGINEIIMGKGETFKGKTESLLAKRSRVVYDKIDLVKHLNAARYQLNKVIKSEA